MPSSMASKGGTRTTSPSPNRPASIQREPSRGTADMAPQCTRGLRLPWERCWPNLHDPGDDLCLHTVRQTREGLVGRALSARRHRRSVARHPAPSRGRRVHAETRTRRHKRAARRLWQQRATEERFSRSRLRGPVHRRMYPSRRRPKMCQDRRLRYRLGHYTVSLPGSAALRRAFRRCLPDHRSELDTQ